MKRLVDHQGDSPEGRAGELLRRVPAPAKLSPAARARIAERLAAARPVGRGRAWLALPALAAAAAALLFFLSRPGPRGAEHVVVPQCGAVPLAAGPGQTLVLDGPGEALLPADHAAPIELRAGRLVARAGDRALTITAPGARVTVAPRGVVEVSIRAGMVTIAAHREAARVDWLETARTLELPAGAATTAAGPTTAPAVDDADRLLALRAPSAHCSAPEAAPPTASAAPSPSLTPSPAPSPSLGPSPPPPARRPAAPAPSRVDERDEPLPSAAPAPPLPSPGDEAARALASALRTLRVERDPARALELLDAAGPALTRGPLADEAELVRLEALLAAGRRGAALTLLEATDLSARVRQDELRLLRAELRAHAGRCAGAIADLDALSDAGGALGERVARVRARCAEGATPIPE